MNDSPRKEEREVVFIPCRRGSDQVTHGQKCDSRRAYKLAPDGTSNALYKCAVCSFSWNVPLGGSFNVA